MSPVTASSLFPMTILNLSPCTQKYITSVTVHVYRCTLYCAPPCPWDIATESLRRVVGTAVAARSYLSLVRGQLSSDDDNASSYLNISGAIWSLWARACRSQELMSCSQLIIYLWGEEIRGPTANCCLVARTPEMACNLATVVLLQHEFIYFLDWFGEKFER